MVKVKVKVLLSPWLSPFSKREISSLFSVVKVKVKVKVLLSPRLSPFSKTKNGHTNQTTETAGGGWWGGEEEEASKGHTHTYTQFHNIHTHTTQGSYKGGKPHKMLYTECTNVTYRYIYLT